MATAVLGLGTGTDGEFVNAFYHPRTCWPKLEADFLPLPDKYNIDLDRAKIEIEELTQKFQIRPFRVGSKSGKIRDRLTYRGLGLTCRPEALDPLYDSLSLYGLNHQPLDIYQTFANYSEKKPGSERVIELLDETNFSEFTEACTPFFHQVLAQFKSPLSKVRLLQLLPGGFIPPHVDFPYYEAIRVHAVIDSNPEVIWEVNGKQFQLPADGRFYWFDTGKYHAVINRGKTPRLVLSVNLLVYKDRDGRARFDVDQSLQDLISQGLV